MRKQQKEFKLFFYGQPFEDGLRITIAILLPSLLLSYADLFELGLTISVGAACVSLTDTPGPIIHRKNTMLFCLVFIFAVAVVTGFARHSQLLMGIVVCVLSFFFSMFTVYGMRAAMVGNAALLTMVLTMDKPIEPLTVLEHSLFLAGGGFWYMVISLLAYRIRPYRMAQRSLGESIRELAQYLSIKADFYNVDTDLNEDYKKLLAQQIIVTEKQDSTREVLFKTRQIVEESTPEGRRLVLAFIHAVDLFEDVTASYYDYRLLRQQYGNSEILNSIYTLAKNIARDLDRTGIAIYANANYSIKHDYTESLSEIKKRIDAFKEISSGSSNLVLKKMLVNVRKIVQRVTDLQRYFYETPEKPKENKADTHTLFVGHQSLDPKIFSSNFTFSSSVFRHALRVCIACGFGFLIAKSFAKGHHSYWIIMTIIFMLKPSFSLTRQRNIERITGTLVGGIIGFVILSLHLPSKLLFGIMVVLMVATYSLQRIKYLVSIVCMTPFILILFNFLGLNFRGLLQERVLDTGIGCFIALLAGYLLFPDWESKQLKNFLQQMLKANTSYLEKLVEGLEGKNISVTEYKLLRKGVYINSANLSAAFERMLSEPASTQKNKNEIHQFVVLNHILFSNIAAMAASIFGKGKVEFPAKILRLANKSLSALNESLEILGEKDETLNHHMPQSKQESIEDTSPDTILLGEQLEFIHKISLDIKKTTAAIIS